MILRAENIVKSFGKKKILKGITFEMNEGALYGIVGENGSGKSTLLKIIIGELKANEGKVIMNGSFGYCPQKPLIFSQLAIKEHFKYFSAAYGLEKNNSQLTADYFLQYFNFEKHRNDKVEILSEGTKQKLNLSLALLHKPDLLILDEPYNGFDWDTYMRFWDLSDELLKKGCTILIVTHLQTEKKRFDCIFNLKDGYLT